MGAMTRGQLRQDFSPFENVQREFSNEQNEQIKNDVFFPNVRIHLKIKYSLPLRNKILFLIFFVYLKISSIHSQMGEK